jgi:hypothetical protein
MEKPAALLSKQQKMLITAQILSLEAQDKCPQM